MEDDPRDKRIEELEAKNRQLREQLAVALARIEEIERASHRQAAPFRREQGKKAPPGARRGRGGSRATRVSSARRRR